MKILCIGNAAYDVTLPVNNYPVENQKNRIDGEKVECGGGSASNCAYLLSMWGVDTYFAGVVGNDYYGDQIKKEFEKIGVNMKYLETRDDIRTTSSYIITNLGDATRTILTDKSKNAVMTKMDIDDDDFDAILLDGYEPDFAKEAIKKNPKAKKIIDAGSLRENTIELAKMVDYVVCSHDFAEQYTKSKIDFNDMKTLIDIYDKLKREFKNNIIITLEDKGCFTYDDGYKMVPSIKVEAVDTTGAGDIYHGAFTYCVAHDYDILTTMKISNITGALSITRMGGRNSIFPLEEIMDKYNELNVQQ